MAAERQLQSEKIDGGNTSGVCSYAPSNPLSAFTVLIPISDTA